MHPSRMTGGYPPADSPFLAGDIATVRRIDENGLQGRDPHPPVDLRGNAVVVLAPHGVIDAASGREFFTEMDPDDPWAWRSSLEEPVWIYDAITVSGEHKGERFHMADYELDQAKEMELTSEAAWNDIAKEG